MKKTSFEDAACPVARALEIIGDWWSLLIVRDAMTGVRRFSDFAQRLGVAKNILSSRLKKLVAHGILETVPARDGSAYREYELTHKGRALFTILVALRQWSDDWLPDEREVREVLVDAKNRQPVGPLELRAADGRTLGLEDVWMIFEERKEHDGVKAPSHSLPVAAKGIS